MHTSLQNVVNLKLSCLGVHFGTQMKNVCRGDTVIGFCLGRCNS